MAKGLEGIGTQGPKPRHDSRKPPLGQDPFIRDKFAQGRSAKRFINYVLGIVGP
jgi:hypothetical protein